MHPSIYEDIHPVGSGPGKLYGLPKVHKPGVPLRPILAAYNTAAYKSAKFLVPLLEPLTSNRFTVKNSFEFHQSVSSLTPPPSAYMCSFDVTSLFTNIPLVETIDIICDTVFSDGTEVFHNFTKIDFKTFLTLAVSDPLFIFDGTFYTQRDGVAMGSPLGPTFANIFLSHHEERWLSNCPPAFKPFCYYRYVDDTFAVFKDKSDSDSFLQYLNSQHPNISFTIEPEINHTLPFLDSSISLVNGSFISGVYRKKTFTGLGTNYFSNTYHPFKLNAVRTLIHRAYHLSSSFFIFHSELQFLSNFFSSNGYPLQLFERLTSQFLNKVNSPKPTVLTVPKLPFFFSAPYYNDQSSSQIQSLVSSLSTFYPQVQFYPSLSNPFTIGSFFNFKDRLPSELMSGVVYKFSCGGCNASYIGCTRQRFKARVCQHIGRSDRTNAILSSPSYSEPRNHSTTCNGEITSSNFSILDSSSSNLFTLESLYIKQQRPSLNNQSSSSTLYIV